MPDPVTATVAGVTAASGAYSAREARKGAQEASGAQERASLAGIEEQREAREAFERRTQPFVNIGLEGREDLLSLLGLVEPEGSDRLSFLTSGGLGQPDNPTINRAERSLAFWQGKLAESPNDPNIQRRASEAQATLTELREEAAGLEQQIADFEASQALPPLPEALDLSQLPASPEAFGPESFRDSQLLDFVMEEGFRGIKEGAAGGGRVPDRDLVRFAQGTASTLLPQLQAQQFAQQQALRSQALGEQAQQFGQLGGLRESAIGEEQRDVANLMNLLRLGQATAVGQGQAALQTGSNISGLLGNIGTAQAGAALGQAQAGQQLAGNLVGLAGWLGGRQQTQPYGGAQAITAPATTAPAPQPTLYAT